MSVRGTAGRFKRPCLIFKRAGCGKVGSRLCCRFEIAKHHAEPEQLIRRFGFLISLTVCILACTKRNDYVERFFEAGNSETVRDGSILFRRDRGRSSRGKRGYIDHAGKLLMSFQFDDTKRFQGRFAIVSNRGRWIWIDKTGRTVAESEIDFIP